MDDLDATIFDEIAVGPMPSDSVWMPQEFVLDTDADYSYHFEISSQPIIEETIAEPAWHRGLEPEPRVMMPGSRSGFILVAVILLVLILLNFRAICSMLRFNTDELLKLRHGRDNVFDERPAMLSLVQMLLTALFIVCGGFLLAGGVAKCIGGTEIIDTMPLVGSVGLVLAYYLFEFTAYHAVGFTFSTPEGSHEWVRGFSASTSLLGVALAVPAMIGVLYPAMMSIMAILAIILFIIAKFMFILKGFRIFYDNFFSLIYFILYLCTLEIIPIILVYNCSVLLLI